MTRYVSDQNKVVMLLESGTYANADTTGITGSVAWIGQVTEHSVDDSENLIETRYLGTSTRNVQEFTDGPRDVTGTLTYNPANMRIPFYAIGSIIDTPSADKSFHLATEVASNVWGNAFISGTGLLKTPMSFTIEDSKQGVGTGKNFIRTVKGAIPNAVTVSSSQGEKVEVSVDYIGQTLAFSSGTSSTTSTVSGLTPFLWNDCSIVISGTTMDTVKSFDFEINNNLEAPHYLNGSRDISAPIPLNRDYTFTVTMDLDAEDTDLFYQDLFKDGGQFNCTLDMDRDVTAVGSQHAIFGMSGCRLVSIDAPTGIEGPGEATLEIRPQSVVGSCFDREPNYNPY